MNEQQRSNKESQMPRAHGRRHATFHWLHDHALLYRSGNKDTSRTCSTTATNVPLYPEFQAFFRERQPPTLIVWGGMTRFPADGADGAGPYPHDLPSADLHLLDTGHFALEDRLEVMAPLIHDFLDRNIASR
jgi:hypothetical protein